MRDRPNTPIETLIAAYDIAQTAAFVILSSVTFMMHNDRAVTVPNAEVF